MKIIKLYKIINNDNKLYGQIIFSDENENYYHLVNNKNKIINNLEKITNKKIILDITTMDNYLNLINEKQDGLILYPYYKCYINIDNLEINNFEEVK